jgi:hypothetical protein
MNNGQPKDVHILISETCEVYLIEQQDFAYVIKLRILRCRYHWVDHNYDQKGPYKREERRSKAGENAMMVEGGHGVMWRDEE